MNRFCSLFSELLQLFPKTEFFHVVKRTGAERRSRGFSCWGQFVAMLFCQLGRAIVSATRRLASLKDRVGLSP